jgi:uncharacterized glyoxalase superfamily protein PhnB
MAAGAPNGRHTLTPRIFATDAAGLVEFLRNVFEATGDFAGDRPAEMQIGDSIVMVSGTEVRPAMPACLYVYVPDADATYARAMEAGAESMEAPLDTPYGDRRAMIGDRWGNIWQIATHR